MTIQPAELVDTDTIGHLDWHEHRRCEHVAHTRRPDLHEDGGEVWVRMTCPDCPSNTVGIRCSMWLMNVAAGVPVVCECGRAGGIEFYEILGPANPTTTS